MGGNVLGNILILFPLGASDAIAQPETAAEVVGSADDAVRLTIELNWAMPQTGSVLPGEANEAGEAARELNLILELTAGRVVDAIAWSPLGAEASAVQAPAARRLGPGPNGSWRLGKAREGRVRVRIEAPLDAGLVVRVGDQIVNMPLVAILGGAAHAGPVAAHIEC